MRRPGVLFRSSGGWEPKKLGQTEPEEGALALVEAFEEGGGRLRGTSGKAGTGSKQLDHHHPPSVPTHLPYPQVQRKG